MFFGIDISKTHLDVAVHGSDEIRRFSADDEGLAQLVEWIAAQSPKVVVMEATGGLEQPAALALSARKLPVAVVNPRQVRASGRPHLAFVSPSCFSCLRGSLG